MRPLGPFAALLLIALIALPSWAAEAPSVSLPADEAAHPQALSERWDLAGHLRSERGRTFGLLVAFRRGNHQVLGKGSLLTLAVVDVDGGLLYADVNLIDRPTSQASPGRLALAWEESHLERLADGGLALEARGLDDRSRLPVGASLTLEPVAPAFVPGKEGRRPFGSPSNPSFQHATSRLAARGTLTLDKSSYPVKGLLWFTHVWGPFEGTSKAFEGMTTWTAHLADGRDLRVEAFRGVKAGQASPPTALWVTEGSALEEILPAPPEVARHWRSIRGVLYPVAWRLKLPGGELACHARLPDGEVLYGLKLLWVRWTSLSWVGSCELEGTLDGQPATGEALIEATGFSPPK